MYVPFLGLNQRGPSADCCPLLDGIIAFNTSAFFCILISFYPLLVPPSAPDVKIISGKKGDIKKAQLSCQILTQTMWWNYGGKQAQID